ncbi:SDR family NAD(P)-dependent oxidoreductase [Enterovibrio nigricans]|uniref:Short-chain dehydrogenase n=1 Tax=Enterovibrio nigricans DSM 22720 TaxID=1121868 RepID=A0A1T4VCN5_9GAMM|nr:SDR family NAD(P)-dependent oxidoreductase [Enterovibrio nigricans]PKF49943.1 oxidoreductase [Enterovibrio nigricans]SKA62628.1 Short-chain dehydrogenase [Enterovibrio nigricans DSM 22720]
MKKTILLTGATDGIGLETAKRLASEGHTLLIHGRNPTKLDKVEQGLKAIEGVSFVESFVADMSSLPDVTGLANAVRAKHQHIDVLLNNAGVFHMNDASTKIGIDARFVVNTISPYLLTTLLLPAMTANSRVVNLSSAAQAPVNFNALEGKAQIDDDFSAYAQSKLAITMWTRILADQHGTSGPVFIAVNPGSMLASKMVQEGFGVSGNDLSIGVDILARAALSEAFANASGKYWDNDAKTFASPHPDGLDDVKAQAIVDTIERIIA